MAHFTLIAVSDGFVGPERTRPATNPRKRRRVTKRNQVLREKGVITSGGLKLATGPLPDTPMPIRDLTVREPELPPTQLQLVDAHEKAVIDQLSRVTAPVRCNSGSECSDPDDSERSDSDSSEYSYREEDPEAYARMYGGEYEDTPESSSLGGSSGTDLQALYSPKENGILS